jgi:general secretion pathway protein G
MGVSTVIGKKQWAAGSGRLAEKAFARKLDSRLLEVKVADTQSLPTAHCLLPTSSRGFTLLELMIVISILVILAVIAMPQYQKSVTHARETVLRDNLYHLRKGIDLYGADKGKLPQSLDDLVTAGYIREVPVDPMTNERDWQIVTGEDPNSLTSETGITDVHSASTDSSTSGTPYNEW